MPADRPARPTQHLNLDSGESLAVTAHDGGAVTIVASRGPVSYTLELDAWAAHLLASYVRPDRFSVGDLAWWNGEWVYVRNGPYVGWGVETMGRGRPSTASDAQLMTRARRERLDAEALAAAQEERAAADAVAAAAADTAP